MLDSLINLLLSGLVALICLTAGRALLLQLSFRFANQSEEMVLSTGVGFGVLIYTMGVLGMAGLYRPAVAWGLLLALMLLGAWAWWRRPRWGRRQGFRVDIRRVSWPLQLLLVLFLVYSVAYALVALTPTLESDSIGGYLLTAREYARQGGIVSIDYAYSNSFPANGQMLSTLGFLLRGQILAQLLLVWLMGLLALATIYAFGTAWLSQRAALVAMVVWYGMYSVGYLATSAKIDLAWAAFDLLALLAFSRWYFHQQGERDLRWLVLAGFFLGMAGGIKQVSLLTAFALSAAVAVGLWQDRKRTLKSWGIAYIALGLPTALALVWVARTYLMTESLAFTGTGLRGDSGVVGFLRTLWQMSMLGNAPSVEGPMGKPIGPTILATVPLLALFRKVDGRVWHILAFCGLMLVLWFSGVQRARHLLPTLALLSLLAGYVITSLLAWWPRLGQTVVVLMVISLGLNLGTWGYINFVSLQRLPYVLGLQNLDGYLTANAPKLSWYPSYAIVAYTREHLPAEARIAALSGGNGYYLERPFYPNWTTPAQVPDPDEFADQLKAAGITHVFTNDYVVNVRGLQDAWLARPEFVADYLQELICAEGQCLYGVIGS
ncbi:hypothetical protein MYX82_00155 [Acidobacteria bacterium AH-259-D05]|nr:hypothetical protein [Acidobacteria bacterium AH-259-D05]